MSRPTPDNSLLLVGLGNPGSAYKLTRHNFGWLVLDALAKKQQATWLKQNKFSGELASFKLASQTIRLLKPLTFMNQSGLSVKLVTDYFKIKKNNIWLLHDDLDLPLGSIRLSYQASAAGHNGVQSIFKALDKIIDWRFRLGLGRSDQNIPTESFVLQKFSTTEQKIVKKTITLAVALLEQSLATSQPTSQTRTINK
ncbi:aminoacyl-tRNA hydrolase [Patescibacteria group bacterium]|nr:aminoacyl-tRNA hydrolase [Patescibacteria group bacterium]